jgi:hypothetical protein
LSRCRDGEAQQADGQRADAERAADGGARPHPSIRMMSACA